MNQGRTPRHVHGRALRDFVPELLRPNGSVIAIFQRWMEVTCNCLTIAGLDLHLQTGIRSSNITEILQMVLYFNLWVRGDAGQGERGSRAAKGEGGSREYRAAAGGSG